MAHSDLALQIQTELELLDTEGLGLDEAELVPSAERPDAERLIVSLSLEDGPDALLTVLRVLDSGIQIDGLTARFSVEASLSASLAGVGFISIVARMGPTERAPSGDESLGTAVDGQEVGSLETSRVVSDLRDTILSAIGPFEFGSYSPNVDVDEAMKPSNAVLAHRRILREMRFALGVDNPEHSGAQLGGEYFKILRIVASELASANLPMLFSHFPHRWAPPAPDGEEPIETRVLRVGFSCDYADPNELAAQQRIRHRLQELRQSSVVARSISPEMFVYDPGIGSDSLSRRFSLVTEGSTVYPDPSLKEHWVGGNRADRICVVYRAPGRVGLVDRFMGHLVSGADDVAVDGMTMAVVDGWTVVMVVVRGYSRSELRERLSALADDEGGVRDRQGLPVDRLLGKSVPDDSVFLTPDGGSLRLFEDVGGEMIRGRSESRVSLWLCWRCGDEPGLMGRIVSAVRSYFEGIGWLLPNVEYAVSRVLDVGADTSATCAGKIRLTAAPSGSEPLGDLATTVEGLRAAAFAVVESATLSWDPGIPEWKKFPVVVREREPDESPWGFLGGQVSF